MFGLFCAERLDAGFLRNMSQPFIERRLGSEIGQSCNGAGWNPRRVMAVCTGYWQRRVIRKRNG